MSKVLACLSGVLVTLAGISGASAQGNSSGATGLELEEIVVTATKRETNLQKTSISIQTYSGEQLQKEGKKRLDEIMQGVIGVEVQTSQVGSSFYMRGVDANGGGAPGGTPAQTSVAVLIDGVYQNRGEVVRGGTLDVAQVEVSRGTQSTNLGASALAGAVSIVTNKPVFEYQASGSLGVGNYHLLNTEGVLNVPLTDSQALRFAYSSSKRDGYISSGAGDSDLQNARLKYRWQASDKLDIVGTVSYNSIGGNGVSDGVLLATGHWIPYTPAAFASGGGSFTAGSCAPVLAMGATVLGTMGCPPMFISVADNVPYFQRSDPWDDSYPKDAWPNNPFRHTTITSYSGDVNWDAGIGTLTVSPSYQYSTFKSAEPPRGTSWMAEDRVQQTKQIEARLASPDNSKLQWMGGLSYYWTNNYGTFTNIIFPGGMGCTASATVSNYCYTWSKSITGLQETKSAYGNVTYSLLDSLRVIGGVRYQTDNKRFVSVPDGTYAGDISGSFTPYDYSCATCSGSRSWNNTSFSAGVEYDLLPQSMVYAKYATGYQPGALDSMNVNGTPKLTTDQITLGIKNRFFDNKLQVNLEAFNNTNKNRNLQGGIPSVTVFSSSGTVTCPTANTGPTATDLYRSVATAIGACLTYAGTGVTVPTQKQSGVDLDISFVPTSNDRLDVAIEYLDAKYTSIPSLNNPYPTVAVIQAEADTTTSGTIPITAAMAQALVDQFATQVNTYNGLPLQNAAKYSGNISYQHEFQFAGGSKLTPRVTATYKTRYWTASGGSANIYTIGQAMQQGKGRYNANGTVNYAIQPTYSTFDAFTTWQTADGKFTISGFIRNIENEPIVRNTNGTTAVTLADPRTYGITLSGNF